MLNMCIYTYSKDKIPCWVVLEIVAMAGEIYVLSLAGGTHLSCYTNIQKSHFHICLKQNWNQTFCM